MISKIILLKKISELSKKEYDMLLNRSSGINDVIESVNLILKEVKQNGDKAIVEFTKQFDNAEIESIEVSKKEIKDAVSSLDKDILTHLKKAASNIREFHKAQLKRDWIKEFSPGIRLGQKITPIDTIGAYVPGGRACYPSTALMTVIPAKVAGVSNVILCTPPGPDGNVNSLTLAAAYISGADRVFRVGGVQAIGGMAYGTETIPKVNKIVGPGNIYVTAAKMICGIAYDFPAGPSEVLIIADDTANPEFIASDILAQAEHDPNAISILLTESEKLAGSVIEIMESLVKNGKRNEIIYKSLKNAAILIGSLDECIEFSNKFAPEHLEIITEIDILDKIKHAGSIFIGNYAPVSAGDYASGTNHVLPTAGYSKVFSGLNIEHFVTVSSIQIIDKNGLDDLSNTIISIAESEGLFAHANSVKIRKKG